MEKLSSLSVLLRITDMFLKKTPVVDSETIEAWGNNYMQYK